MAMLEYTKLVLQKVSFDRGLFSKELKKSIRFLKEEELELLHDWCLANFSEAYADIVQEAFLKPA